MSQSNEKITVVVPCYNVENYLDRCLNSLLGQTNKNFDVILVEDCSTDATKKIIGDYVKKNKNFRAIYNKKNGGLGNARNVGIENTKSKYILFLDSDDWYPPDYIEEMQKTIEETKADIAVCDIFLRFDNKSIDQRVVSHSGIPDRTGLIDTGMAPSSCNKLFKTILFKDMQYPTNMVNEDIPVVLTLLSRAKTAYNSKTFYNYYQRTGSIQNSKITNKRFDIIEAVALLRSNLNNAIDEKLWEIIVWHQIIAVLLYVIPKADGLIYRKNLIKDFSDRLAKSHLDIQNNIGLDRYKSQRRINKIYGELAIYLITRKKFLVVSVLMWLHFNYIHRKSVRSTISFVAHPTKLVKGLIPRKKVIRKNIRLKDVVDAAKIQKSLRSNDLRISVIIPNYNYEHFLLDRTYSILSQTKKIYEIIILDDNSSDNSVKLAKKIQKSINKYITVRLINNKVNKGVFSQWERGFAEAKGSFIWIAEADDYCDRHFLENTLKPMKKNPDVLISYVNTGYINEVGNLLGNVKNDIDYQKSGHWDQSYVNKGLDEAKTYTYLNNTIANVSSVVFRKRVDIKYDKLFSDARKYRQAGDWLFYMNYMVYGDIAYTDKILNYYRIHGGNVSSTTKAQDHVNEILEIQKSFIKKLNLNRSQQKAMDDRINLLKKAWNNI